MLLYVIVAVPLNVAFAVDPELWSTLFFIDMIVVRPKAVCNFWWMPPSTSDLFQALPN